MKKVTMQEYLDELHAKEAKMMEPAAVSKAIAGLAAELWYGVTKDKIVFRTDYDADGICSAYILSKAMMAVHPDKKIEVRVNDRRGSYAALEDPADDTVQYIVMDMGSNALPALSERYGDVLVVDHHLVNQAEDLEEIRKNPRFLNPKTIGEGLCDYCTTGLAYRLYQELNKIFDLAPFKHVSAYRYARPERENAPKLLDEDETLQQESEIRDFLLKRGFSRYEISSYSLRGFESRHNMLYWTYSSWLGIGAGAASFIRKTGVSSRYADDIDAFIEGEGLSSVELTLQERLEEFLLMGLRVKIGINLNDFKDLFGKEFFELVSEKVVSDLVSKGLLEFDENRKILKCTEKGSDFLNAILLKLFDAIRC